MPGIRNLFTDYNNTLVSGYLEIPVAYGLARYHHNRGEFLKESSLRMIKQPKIWAGYLAKGSDAIFSEYVHQVLMGEPDQAIQEAIERVSKNTGELTKGILINVLRASERVRQKMSNELDPEAVEVFERAREKEMATGIYSRSLRPLIEGYLKGIGRDGLFDTVMANELLYEDGVVTGMQERILPGKVNFADDLSAEGYDARETAYVDDKDLAALEQAGLGILAPRAKDETRELCREKGIVAVSRWGEVGDLLGLWSPD